MASVIEPGQQILHVLGVGIELDGIQGDLLQNARRRDVGIIQRLHQAGEFVFQRGAHDVVGVVDDERDTGMVLLVDAARILRRNDDGAVETAGAHILHGLFVAVVGNGSEGMCVGLDRGQSFPNFHGLRAAVLIDDAEARVLDLATKGVAQHDELHQRKHHRHQHQRRRAEEFAQFALDNGPHSIHKRLNPGVSPAKQAAEKGTKLVISSVPGNEGSITYGRIFARNATKKTFSAACKAGSLFLGQATQHSAPKPGAACWAVLPPSRGAGLGSACDQRRLDSGSWPLSEPSSPAACKVVP